MALNSSSEETPAVSVKNGWKSYKKGTPVLKNFNMEVPSGAIYSLLGSSGCGKTTLLSCIVGLKKLNSGVVKVFGHPPGTQQSGIPGPTVGYMPQELALYNDLTIKEALRFYSRIYGLGEFEKNFGFLMDLLNLPGATRLISSLSGGQKRRVSLAITLIHQPRLLILDEPTVGVDPLLRQSIWDHLVELSSANGTSIIITTHSVEEARRSNVVGIMRNGKLLAEDAPSKLMSKFQVNLLQEIVVLLCRQDMSSSSSFDEIPEIEEKFNSEHENPSPLPSSGVPLASNDMSASGRRLWALLVKNCVGLVKNWKLLFFLFILPTLCTSFVCLTVGPDPTGLNLGVVNFENCDWEEKISQCPIPIEGKGTLSCFFLSLLPKDIFILEKENSLDRALQGVSTGAKYGLIYFPENFTENFFNRFGISGNYSNRNLEEIWDGSTITIELDMSNKQVGQTMKKALMETYALMTERIKINCVAETHSNTDFMTSDLPLIFKKPVYGNAETTYAEFIAPSNLLGHLFFFPLCFAAISYIGEKKSGTLERALVAGVNAGEFLGAFLISQTVILTGQSALTFLVVTQIFQIEILGSVFLANFLAVLVGLGGTAVGFLIALFASDEVYMVMLAIGTYFPNILLSGMVWPLEGMSKGLQYVAFSLPCTLASNAMRSIVSRGWDLGHPGVWPGFLVSIGWTAACWAMAALVYRIKIKI